MARIIFIKRFLLLFAVALSAYFSISAANVGDEFKADGISYIVTSNEEVSVIYQGTSYINKHYKGDIVIPQTVEDNGYTYTVTGIADETFYNCNEITSLSLPATIVSIGIEAFVDCTELTELTIPESVTSIGSGAFKGCSAFTDITIPDMVETIGQGAFESCTGLQSVTIGASVTSIADNTFKDCSSLIKIVIPDNVETIGRGAFDSCEKLQTVTVGANVRSIDDDAFRDCTELTEITSLNYTPPTLTADSFSGVTTASVTVNVPAGSYDSYANDDYWRYFFVKNSDQTTGIEESGTGEAIAVEVARCDITGRMLAAPQAGVNIVRYSDGSVEKVFVK